jgi:hypothetical protein
MAGQAAGPIHLRRVRAQGIGGASRHIPRPRPGPRQHGDGHRANREYLRGELQPATNGLALFLCAGAHGFFEAARFEAPFERHELHVGPQSRGGGLGVVGVRRTRVALEEGRVDELVIAAWPDALTGDPDDAAQLADTLVTTARRTAAQVTFIEDSARLRAIGGVGAFLRYRMSAGLC